MLRECKMELVNKMLEKIPNPRKLRRGKYANTISSTYLYNRIVQKVVKTNAADRAAKITEMYADGKLSL